MIGKLSIRAPEYDRQDVLARGMFAIARLWIQFSQQAE